MDDIVSYRTTGLETYSFKKLPNIYQIELVGGICNLRCPLCPVTNGEVTRRSNLFNVEYLDNMIERGDFDNTLYVELQMYGEPTLHPKMKEAVLKLKSAGLKVGVSTNGVKWNDGLKYIDFITLSADSIQYRIGRNEKGFNNMVVKILNESEAKIDVQVVEIGDWKEQIEKLKIIFGDYKDRVLIRTIPDCFGSNIEKSNIDDFCINILSSVSIQSDGDVVPCCFEWGKELVIGNIFENSLEEIWNGQKRKELLKRWINNDLPRKCKGCKFRSPQLLHVRMMNNWLKKGWL